MRKQLSALMRRKEVLSRSSLSKMIAIHLISVSKAISLFLEMLKVISIWRILTTWESLNDKAVSKWFYTAKYRLGLLANAKTPHAKSDICHVANIIPTS